MRLTPSGRDRSEVAPDKRCDGLAPQGWPDGGPTLSAVRPRSGRRLRLFEQVQVGSPVLFWEGRTAIIGPRW